mgnify:FL=1
MPLKRTIYLISPQTPDNFWSMQSSVEALRAKSLMPNAALATLMALTPAEAGIKYLYCDENVSRIDFNAPCDLVAITGYGLHADRIAEISRRFRERGVAVALGGAYATLYPEQARQLADHHFVGEAEQTWPQFLREWRRGEAKHLYRQAQFVDMTQGPAPDWSKIRAADYLYFPIQTSRGCPNNCDFCDAIRLVGRRYRTKSIAQIMAEVKNAHAKGAETVFFSEDNFFVNRKFTKRLLTRIIAWNTSQRYPLSFSAQATISIGADEQILKLLADANFSVVFLGVESTDKACLEEVNKGHIWRYDPARSVKALSRYGIIPFVGLIVGFDHDDHSTFSRIERFLNDTASPIASLSLLNAPENTALYERMRKQGRINDRFKGVWHFSTNIVPLKMTRDELTARHHALFKRLYEPEQFERRVLDWLAGIRYFTPLYPCL